MVQAYAYAKYLGHLVLTFDEGGKLINYDGNPILLKQDLPQGKLSSNLRATRIILSNTFSGQPKNIKFRWLTINKMNRLLSNIRPQLAWAKWSQV